MDFLKKMFGGNNTDFKELVKDGALIIDVRSPQEYSSGHIQGSTNIPSEKIQNNINDLKKKGKPVITVCRSGPSSIAQSVLSSAGIEAYNGGPWFSLEKKLA